MEIIFNHTENSKASEPQIIVLNPSQRLDLISSNKHVVLQTLYIYYTCRNLRKQYKDNKLKIIAQT